MSHDMMKHELEVLRKTLNAKRTSWNPSRDLVDLVEILQRMERRVYTLEVLAGRG